MNLYEITGELGQAIQLYNDAETDEQLAELEKKLLAVNATYKEKCVAVAKFTLNLESEAAQIDAEIARLLAIKEARENKTKRLRKYLKGSMDATETRGVDGVTVKIKIVSNPERVEVLDEERVPEQYKKHKTVTTIDKTAIKEAWASGVGVDGTEIKRDTRLVIK